MICANLRAPWRKPRRSTPPAEAKVVEGSDGLLLEIDGQVVPNYDATIVPFEEGDVVTGRVVRIDADEVLVDIGYKSEGVIPSNELSIRKSVDPSEEVELGEEVDALVLTKEDQDGRLILSKKRARFEKAWRNIERAAESGEPVEGTVIEVVKGGLIVDLGVRGFLPASLVDIRRVPNLDAYLARRSRPRSSSSTARATTSCSRAARCWRRSARSSASRSSTASSPGMVVEGQISNIVDFGAFVDLDGIDGLIHISELSWSHVNHPSEILSIGDTVQVKVLDIDRDRQRISLGLKQTQEDPWQRVVQTYNVGDELEGKVTKVVTFGAFVEILDGVEGLVHISELAAHHVENPREVVEPGDDVRVKILEIDSERRRLSLSIKRVEGQVLPRRGVAARRRRQTSTTCPTSASPRTSSPTRFPPSRSRGRRRGRRRRGGRRRAPRSPAPAEAPAGCRRGRLPPRGGARARGRRLEATPEPEAARPRSGARRARPPRRPRPAPARGRRRAPSPERQASSPRLPRPGRGPLRRPDRRHRRRQVRGAGRARAPGRRHALHRRGRARALRGPTRCATSW